MDMCTGPLLKKLLIFAVPLILSGVLQLLFNAADIVVVGKFAGSHALAASGIYRCADQPVYQCVYRFFHWCQCTGCPVFWGKR